MSSKKKLVERLHLIDDEPIRSFKDDYLGMGSYADVIAGTVLGTTGPFTIGVYGDWGQGKTSLLRAAQSLLQQTIEGELDALGRRATESEFPYVVTVFFNAWQYEREEHPVVPLVAEIERAVRDALRDEDKVAKRFGKATVTALKRIGGAALALIRAASLKAKVGSKLPPLAEGSVETELSGKDVVEGFEQIFQEAKGEKRDGWSRLVDECTYLTIFNHLDTIRDGLGGAHLGPEGRHPRIVVFIDDLDRCQPDKAFELIEALKVVLAQPGFIFVLGLNKKIVDVFVHERWKKRLGDQHRADADRHLDKIVQLPLYLRTHQKAFQGLVDHILDDRLKDTVSSESLGVFQDVRAHLGKTTSFGPRTLIRRINTLLVDQRLCPDLALDKNETVRALKPEEFLGLCLVQRTLLDDLTPEIIRSISDEHALCQRLANSSVLELLDEAREARHALAKLRGELGGSQPATGSEPIDHRSSSPNDLPWERWQMLLNHVAPFDPCKYVLTTTHGRRWLENPPYRDIVSDFVGTRPETASPKIAGTTSAPMIEVMQSRLGAKVDVELVAQRELIEQRTIIERVVRRTLSLASETPVTTEHWSNLKALSLSQEAINDIGVQWLARADANRSSLTLLDLSNTQVTDAGVRAMVSKGSGLSSLTSLDLSVTQITDAGVKAMAGKESGLSSLTSLYLRNTQIADSGVKALVAKDSSLASLTLLNLRSTQITDEGVKLLASKDSGLQSLASLYLGSTQITDLGVRAMAAKSSGLSSLTVLDLSDTQITDAVVRALGTKDGGFLSLVRLYLRNTQITGAGLALVHKARPDLVVLR